MATNYIYLLLIAIHITKADTETSEVEVLTEAGRNSNDYINSGCMELSSTHVIDAEVPALIDGDNETNAIKTCDRVNAVGFSDSKIRNGCFKLYWALQSDMHGGEFSFATSEDGQTWTRIGNCNEYNGENQQLKNGMCLDAPNIAFRYLATSTACWDNYLREVEWHPQG